MRIVVIPKLVGMNEDDLAEILWERCDVDGGWFLFCSLHAALAEFCRTLLDAKEKNFTLAMDVNVSFFKVIGFLRKKSSFLAIGQCI